MYILGSFVVLQYLLYYRPTSMCQSILGLFGYLYVARDILAFSLLIKFYIKDSACILAHRRLAMQKLQRNHYVVLHPVSMW